MIPISFEYFPPKTDEQRAVLKATHKTLKSLNPEYCSVTFGAGGSTLAFTENTAMSIHAESGIDAAPHISCLGGSQTGIKRLLDTYRENGIKRLVALRGDLPSGMAIGGEFRWANELVAYIRQETGDYFHIEVACYPEIHPEAESAERDMKHFKRKVDAGANGAITQYFFNADAYFNFVDEAQKTGINIPIVPGIMPITNFTQLSRFSDSCGAELPRWLRRKLQGYGDDRNAIQKFGTEFGTQLCQQLIDGGAPGLHFYTLNRSAATQAICKNLGVKPKAVSAA